MHDPVTSIAQVYLTSQFGKGVWKPPYFLTATTSHHINAMQTKRTHL